MRVESARAQWPVRRQHWIHDAHAQVDRENKVKDHYGGHKVFFELVVHSSRLSHAPAPHDNVAGSVWSKILSAKANIQQARIGLAAWRPAAKMTPFVRRRSTTNTL